MGEHGPGGGKIELLDSESEERYDLGTCVTYEVRAPDADGSEYRGEIRCKLSPDRRSAVASAIHDEQQRRTQEPSYTAFRVLEMQTFPPNGLWQQFDYKAPHVALSPVGQDGFTVISFETTNRVRVG
jgi:hypothetical protein